MTKIFEFRYNSFILPTIENSQLFLTYKHVLDEARLLSELKHTNIVRIYEAQRSEHCLYIILEFMEGGNMDVLIKARKEEPFEDSVILSYSKQVGF